MLCYILACLGCACTAEPEYTYLDNLACDNEHYYGDADAHNLCEPDISDFVEERQPSGYLYTTFPGEAHAGSQIPAADRLPTAGPNFSNRFVEHPTSATAVIDKDYVKKHWMEDTGVNALNYPSDTSTCKAGAICSSSNTKESPAPKPGRSALGTPMPVSGEKSKPANVQTKPLHFNAVPGETARSPRFVSKSCTMPPAVEEKKNDTKTLQSSNQLEPDLISEGIHLKAEAVRRGKNWRFIELTRP